MTKEKKKILFVINPISGDTSKSETEKEIKAISHENTIDPSFYYTTGKDDITLLKKAIDYEHPTVVVAVGGDGTCNLVGIALLNMQMTMGIIPFGSANGMAKALDIPNDLVKALNIIAKKHTKTIDILKVNNNYAMHLSDVGLNARIVRKFEKNKTRGLYGYAKQFAKEIFSIQSHKYKINLNEKTFTTKALMIVMANANKYGTGAIINPNGKIDDGFFELVIIKPYRSIGFLKIVRAFFTGNYKNIEFVEIHKTRKAKIINFDKQTLQVDGEIAGKPKIIDLEIIPEAIEIIIP